MAETALPALVDIIAPLAPPPAPPPYGWIAFGLGIALLVTLIVARVWWQRSRHRRAALAQIKHAEHALQQQQLDPRGASFKAAQALSLAYNLHHPTIQSPRPSGERARVRGNIAPSSVALPTSPPPPQPSPCEGEGIPLADSAWTDFLSALDAARYAPHPPSPQDAAQLIAQTRHWIKRAPC